MRTNQIPWDINDRDAKAASVQPVLTPGFLMSHFLVYNREQKSARYINTDHFLRKRVFRIFKNFRSFSLLHFFQAITSFTNIIWELHDIFPSSFHIKKYLLFISHVRRNNTDSSRDLGECFCCAQTAYENTSKRKWSACFVRRHWIKCPAFAIRPDKSTPNEISIRKTNLARSRLLGTPRKLDEGKKRKDRHRTSEEIEDRASSRAFPSWEFMRALAPIPRSRESWPEIALSTQRELQRPNQPSLNTLVFFCYIYNTYMTSSFVNY